MAGAIENVSGQQAHIFHLAQNLTAVQTRNLALEKQFAADSENMLNSAAERTAEAEYYAKERESWQKISLLEKGARDTSVDETSSVTSRIHEQVHKALREELCSLQATLISSKNELSIAVSNYTASQSSLETLKKYIIDREQEIHQMHGAEIFQLKCDVDAARNGAASSEKLLQMSQTENSKQNSMLEQGSAASTGLAALRKEVQRWQRFVLFIITKNHLSSIF